MWCLHLSLFLLLNSDFNFVTTNYILNTNAVTWTAAQNICDVPSVDEIMHTTNKAYIKLPETFKGWTSSTSTTSDWASFHGCLDVSVINLLNNAIKRQLNKYFPYSPNATTLKSVFECAYFCTRKGDVFTFFRHVCKCINQSEFRSELVMRPVCISSNLRSLNNVDDVYLMSGSSLPIFKFETGFRNMNIPTGDTERRKHHCLARSINGTLTDSDCRSTKNYCCVGDEEDEQCVAIQRINISLSLTKKFRPCSEHLPVLCNDEQNTVKTSTPVFGNHGSQLSETSTESTSDRSIGTISTNTSYNQKPDENNVTLDLCIKIAAGGTTSFAIITVLLLVIIFIQRRKLTKARYVTLTVRRDQNNYNEVPHEMSDSITGQYYEVSPLSEIPASGCQITAQQNIAIIQHIDTSGYLIHSGMLETDGDYQTIAD